MNKELKEFLEAIANQTKDPNYSDDPATYDDGVLDGKIELAKEILERFGDKE